MPLTPSQKSAAFRQRRAERIARMEAALREIAGGCGMDRGATFYAEAAMQMRYLASEALAKLTNT